MKTGFKAFANYLIIPAFLSIVFNSFVENNLILANVLFYLVLLFYFMFLSRHEIKDNWIDFRKNFKKYLPIILKWVFIGFILMIASNYIIQLFIDTLPTNEISNRKFIESSPILSILYLLLIAPLSEEYVFRFSFKSIKHYYIYTIFTSLLFSSLHLLSITSFYELWYFIPYFIFSFGFSNIFFKTQNYFASSFGHIIHNTLCVIIILLF